jgi:ribose transport system ATP-binding protein
MENGKVLKVLNKKEYTSEMVTTYTLDFSHVDISPAYNTSKDGILNFQNIFTESIKDMSFTVGKGECVVMLDMNNTALMDIMKLMNREIKPLSGDILLNGCNFTDKTCQLKRSICFIQENPIKSMLFKEMNYIDNLCFLVYEKQPYLWLNKTIKRSIIMEYETLIGGDIYTNDITDLPPLSLYNLIYYRIHLFNPKVVVCVQPFSGADMYLRHHVVELINQLRKKMITVIILAVNISDCLVVADRLMLIEHGKLCKEYSSEEFHFFNASQ